MVKCEKSIFWIIFLYTLTPYGNINLLRYFTVRIQNLYCFHYTPSNEELIQTAGWEFFKLDNEYRRMRVPNEQWTLCNLNKTYDVTSSYIYNFRINSGCNSNDTSYILVMRHVPKTDLCTIACVHRNAYG